MTNELEGVRTATVPTLIAPTDINAVPVLLAYTDEPVYLERCAFSDGELGTRAHN